MKTFKKIFVGKGKQVEGLQIIKVTVNMNDLNKFIYNYNGDAYATFEIAKMKEADKFGREFTVYVSRKEDASEVPEKVEEPAKTSKPKKAKKNKIEPAELPL